MLYQMKSYQAVDERKLMDIYYEDNVVNSLSMFPDIKDKDLRIKKCEEDYLSYLKNEFFKIGNTSIWVLTNSDEVWVSALRLYRIKNDVYYLEALATHPYYRKNGYASKLIRDMINVLKKEGDFRLFSCVNKQNLASLRVHEKCGFVTDTDREYNVIYSDIKEDDYSLKYDCRR